MAFAFTPSSNTTHAYRPLCLTAPLDPSPGTMAELTLIGTKGATTKASGRPGKVLFGLQLAVPGPTSRTPGLPAIVTALRAVDVVMTPCT